MTKAFPNVGARLPVNVLLCNYTICTIQHIFSATYIAMTLFVFIAFLVCILQSRETMVCAAFEAATQAWTRIIEIIGCPIVRTPLPASIMRPNRMQAIHLALALLQELLLRCQGCHQPSFGDPFRFYCYGFHKYTNRTMNLKMFIQPNNTRQ